MKIIITGTTGVGKSTSVDILESLLKKQNKPVVRVGELVVHSPFFDYYFEDLSSWGFLSQVSFLLDRFKQWLEVDKKINKYIDGTINIFDRHFLDDLIFSELIDIKESISNFDVQTYSFLYKSLLEKLMQAEKIDYLFLLKADFNIIKERMLNRGRESELVFLDKYWMDLYKRYYEDEKYQNHFKKYSKRMIIIDTTHKNATEVAKEILGHINNEYSD